MAPDANADQLIFPNWLQVLRLELLQRKIQSRFFLDRVAAKPVPGRNVVMAADFPPSGCVTLDDQQPRQHLLVAPAGLIMDKPAPTWASMPCPSVGGRTAFSSALAGGATALIQSLD